MKKIKSISLFIFLSLFLINTFAQNIVINEIMSSNSSAIADEDGDYSDWLELYNTSTTTVDNVLGNFDFGLSKDGEDLRLFNADGELIDIVSFMSKSPWPSGIYFYSLAMDGKILGINKMVYLK